MKVPFDISLRPQIESGEYKVETRSGKEVKIVYWELNGFEKLLLVIDGRAEKVGISGRTNGTGWDDSLDLFVSVPDPKFKKGNLIKYQGKVYQIEDIELINGGLTWSYRTKLITSEGKDIIKTDFGKVSEPDMELYVDPKVSRVCGALEALVTSAKENDNWKDDLITNSEDLIGLIEGCIKKDDDKIKWKYIHKGEYPDRQMNNIITACRNKNKPDGIWLYDICDYYPGTGFQDRTNYEDVLAWAPLTELIKEPKE